MKKSKQLKAKISYADSKLAICFENPKAIKKVVKILKNKFNVRSSWKNYAFFYLALFDDFVKIYQINKTEFIIEPDGFTYMDGFALWTDVKNELVFYQVLESLKENLNLVLEENNNSTEP